MRSPIMNRQALFDIGVAGPIVGFVAAVLAINLRGRHRHLRSIKPGMKLAGRRDHHTTGGQQKRNEQSERKVEDRKPPVQPTPTFFKQGIWQQPGHIDTHRGAKSGDDDVTPPDGVFDPKLAARLRR